MNDDLTGDYLEELKLAYGDIKSDDDGWLRNCAGRDVNRLISEILRLRASNARLNAKCDQQQRDIMDLRTELARSVI